jgi:hypothetical protein
MKQFLTITTLLVLVCVTGFSNPGLAAMVVEEIAPRSAGQSDYPLIEDFDSDAGFTATTPSQVYISDGKAHWDLTQTISADQFIYRSIPPFTGDFKMTVVGQIDTNTGNYAALIGIGNTYNTGLGLRIGYHGAGCPSGGHYFDGGRGVSLSAFESGCVFTGNWLFIDPMTEYTATLTIQGSDATLEVDGVGVDTGLAAYGGTFNTLYIGGEGGTNTPEASGSIERIIIERIFGNTYLPLVFYNSGPCIRLTQEYSVSGAGNNNQENANGPVCESASFIGYPDDWEDYFWVKLDTTGTISLTLTDHPLEAASGVQLQLFKESIFDNPVAADSSPPYTINYAGLPGTYYVLVYSDQSKCTTECSQPYTLNIGLP